MEMEGGGREVFGEAGKQQDGEPEKRATLKPKCGFWLERKKRFCSNLAKPGHEHCGNHLPTSSNKRVPCPVDPSHDIFKSEVAKHVLVCPFAVQQAAASSQPFYSKSINEGSSDSEIEGNENDPVTHSRGKNNAHPNSDEYYSKHPSARKREALMSLSEVEFKRFIEKLEEAFDCCCSKPIETSICKPAVCDKWFALDTKRCIPFETKHALQQASIVGNLEKISLISSVSPTPSSSTSINPESHESGNHVKNDNSHEDMVVVEFGAGRAYLSQMLCECYGLKNIVLVEKSSYKFKADRTLRKSNQAEVIRIRTNIQF